MTQIGIVYLNYKQDGTLKEAKFEPTVKLEAKQDFVDQLNTVKSSDEPAKILAQAQRIFSGWFSFMTQMELDDSLQVVGEIDYGSCQKYENGTVKFCKIIFKQT